MQLLKLRHALYGEGLMYIARSIVPFTQSHSLAILGLLGLSSFLLTYFSTSLLVSFSSFRGIATEMTL